MTTEHPILRFTLAPEGLRHFNSQLSQGLGMIIGLRFILAGLVLVPILISKNPIIDTVSVVIVVALIGWSIHSMLKLRTTKQSMSTYTIIIDGESVTVDMEYVPPFSIPRADISNIESTDDAFIVNGKVRGDTIIIPRGVNDPQGLLQAIRDLQMGVRRK